MKATNTIGADLNFETSAGDGAVATASISRTTTPTTGRSSTMRRTGLTLRGIAIAFLAFDASVKVLQTQMAIDGTMQLGYPVSSILYIGLAQVAFLLLYIVPRTSILGAVLWTGYLGGAVATHVRMGNPLLTHTLSPIYVAVVLWLGLWLTDRRLRRVFEAIGEAATTL